MTHIQLIIVKDNKIIKKSLPGAKVTFHGKFYITVNYKDYRLQHQPVYSSNTDTVILICTELDKEEKVNNYEEPDTILVTTLEDRAKFESVEVVDGEERHKYYKYDWDYTPFVECEDDHLCFYISVDQISEETKKLIPEEVGLSAAVYLKETGNKSIWKDGKPKYVIG